MPELQQRYGHREAIIQNKTCRPLIRLVVAESSADICFSNFANFTSCSEYDKRDRIMYNVERDIMEPSWKSGWCLITWAAPCVGLFDSQR